VKKFFSFFLFFLILIIICSALVSAARVSPPKFDSVPYAEGESVDFDMTIWNNGETPYVYHMSADSFISEYVTFNKNSIPLLPGEQASVTATLTFPLYETISDFGIQKLYFKSEESVDPRYSSGTFSAVTAVRIYVPIEVPIPGEYAEIKEITIPNPEKGENTYIELVLSNKGVLDLFDTSTTISVMDREGNLLDTLYFNNVDISATQSVTVNQTLHTESYDSGMYLVHGDLKYSPEKIPSTKDSTFFIGGVDVLLLDYTKTLTKGKINNIKFNLQSIFSQDLKNIRGSLIDFNDSLVNLPVIDFKPYELTIVDAFMFVPKTNDTTFESVLTLEIPVPDKGIETKTIPLLFNITDPETIKDNTSFFSKRTNLYLVLIIVFLIIMVLLFTFSMKKDKKDAEKKKKTKSKEKTRNDKKNKKDFDWSE